MRRPTRQGAFAELPPLVRSDTPDTWAPEAPARTRSVKRLEEGTPAEGLESLVVPPPAVTDFDLSYPVPRMEQTMEVVQGTVSPPSPAVLLDAFLAPEAPLSTRRAVVRLRQVDMTPPNLVQLVPSLLQAFPDPTYPEKSLRVKRLEQGEYREVLLALASIPPERWLPLSPEQVRRVIMRSRGGMTEPTHVPAPAPPDVLDWLPFYQDKIRRVKIRDRGGERTPWFLVVPPPASAIVWTGSAFFGLDFGDDEALFGLDFGSGDALFGLDFGEDDAEFGT